MALEFADDRGRCVGRESHPALGIESIDGVEETDARNLLQVVGVLTSAGELSSEVFR